ncbi:MAG: DUF3224 domain-containing protein [Gammaproteobacteria bacterium]|nr:DUF3224 domain-containing protein [Gammaproteobacteria bacterium]
MDQQAKGEFDVSRTAEPDCDMGDGAVVGRNRFDKRFHGGLDASSVVQMLSVGTGVSGSAAYVALERVAGGLQGRAGSFFLQHSGTMARGAPTLSLTVVPDSGTDELIGLSGRMSIDIVEGKHFYIFDYALDAAD